jgi:hypothetical protein
MSRKAKIAVTISVETYFPKEASGHYLSAKAKLSSQQKEEIATVHIPMGVVKINTLFQKLALNFSVELST